MIKELSLSRTEIEEALKKTLYNNLMATYLLLARHGGSYNNRLYEVYLLYSEYSNSHINFSLNFLNPLNCQTSIVEIIINIYLLIYLNFRIVHFLINFFYCVSSNNILTNPQMCVCNCAN